MSRQLGRKKLKEKNQEKRRRTRRRTEKLMAGAEMWSEGRKVLGGLV